jgi:nitrogen regulatory protein PII
MKENHSCNAWHVLLAVVFSVVFIIPPLTFAQTREYLLKAGYIEKFTHFVEWPGISKTQDPTIAFSIAVIGENKFGSAIEKIFSNVKIGNKKVRIIYISSVDEIKDCNILIISESKRNELDEILNYTAGKPILTIGETSGYGKRGVVINMFIESNHIRYEINRTALDKSGLKISSLLLSSAIIVKTDE